MVHARIEEHILHDVLSQRRTLQHVREPAIAPPVIRHRAAAVRNDEAQRWEILEQIAFDELHERRRVSVDVVRARGVEARVARRRDMNHGRHVELDHLLVKRIPVLISQRRRGPVTARRIGIQVTADEAQVCYAAFEFLHRVRDRHAR